MNDQALKDLIKSSEHAKVRGFIRLQIRDKEGNIRDDTGFMENVITNAGLAVMSGLVGNTGSQTAFTYLAVGSDATAASAGQTALISEITTAGLGRASATVSRSTTNQTNDTLQFDKTWSASGAITVEEIGVFNNATAGLGTMLARKVTGTKALANGEDLIATYKIIFT